MSKEMETENATETRTRIAPEEVLRRSRNMGTENVKRWDTKKKDGVKTKVRKKSNVSTYFMGSTNAKQEPKRIVAMLRIAIKIHCFTLVTLFNDLEDQY